ncbi:hypothetical protein C2845_PM03G04410 [Panicum miliaceum]|uniref:Uncharacterized protein n=1 Tax=Panicum miliaceum TaxID=4540 RepID=A0A3L6TD42_PANMI|nr:hypothetical protein C2845_PM03G04410 [Panicum miliaceum]
MARPPPTHARQTVLFQPHATPSADLPDIAVRMRSPSPRIRRAAAATANARPTFWDSPFCGAADAQLLAADSSSRRRHNQRAPRPGARWPAPSPAATAASTALRGLTTKVEVVEIDLTEEDAAASRFPAVSPSVEVRGGHPRRHGGARHPD